MALVPVPEPVVMVVVVSQLQKGRGSSMLQVLWRGTGSFPPLPPVSATLSMVSARAISVVVVSLWSSVVRLSAGQKPAGTGAHQMGKNEPKTTGDKTMLKSTPVTDVSFHVKFSGL